MDFFRKTPEFDFVGKMGAFLGISGLFVLASLLAVIVNGLNFGIDFAGGHEIQTKFPNDVGDAKVKELIEPLVSGDARVQRYGAAENHEYLITVRSQTAMSAEEQASIKGEFEKLAGGSDKLFNWALAESGESLTVGFAQPVTDDQVKNLLASRGLQVKKMTRNDREDQPEYSIILVSVVDNIESALRKGLQIDANTPIIQRVEFVGPQVGKKLRNDSWLAILYSMVFVLLYVAVRFDFFFAPGAIVALIHDEIITIGVFALFGLEFNLQTVAALLTLAGYSLNDTIVVYDRVRENIVRMRGRELRSLINISLNQTLSRTLLTGSTTMLALTALVLMGGPSIRDFALALLVGFVVGTYSSLGVASPIYIYLREWLQKSTATAGANKAAAA